MEVGSFNFLISGKAGCNIIRTQLIYRSPLGGSYALGITHTCRHRRSVNIGTKFTYHNSRDPFLLSE